MTRLTVAGVTLNQIPFDWKHNVSNILSGIEEARKAGARLVLFPELCISGYGCEDLFLSDWFSATAFEKLLSILPHTGNITACVGLPIRIQGTTYNGAAVIRNGELLGISLKQNLAREGVHYEPRWFDPWPAGKVADLQIAGRQVRVGELIYETDGIRFGFEICEDAWSRSHRPGYHLLERGVDLILNPSASHFAMGKAGRREKEVIVDGSSKFKCAYLFVNHLGNEAGRMIYDGDIVFGQMGQLLAINDRLAIADRRMLTCTLDFENPALSERKPITDGREKNDEFVRAGSLALYDYLRKSKSKGFVLSLSGGADSSCCAILVSEMVRRASEAKGWETFWSSIGYDPGKSPRNVKEAVHTLLACAYQSTKNSSVATLESARNLANSIGSQFYFWSVEEEVSGYRSKIESALERKMSWETDDIALQNIQARARSPIIWMLANLRNSILLTTSNRSEGAVGYATMDGDTSGSLAPIAGVDKVFIIQWLRWAQHSLGYEGLKAVNQLQPTAELRPHERAQTDEKDLMPYPVLAAIERLALLERKNPLEIYRLLSSSYDKDALKGWIRKFFRLWSVNQWKRERLAPAFHLDDLNVDPRSWYRFPILSGGFQEELDALDTQ
ncbi:MAG: NAD(+) synthase [Bacteroidetes bacterium]|nr:NAD(+) synthase [Bacteroidota bacterium]